MIPGDIIRRTAVSYPHKVGVIFGDQKYTWQGVNTRVNRLANGLLKLGLQKQDKVAILCPNCNQYLEFYLAISKAGLVGVPLNYRFIGKELALLINHSEAKVLITSQDYIDTLEGMSSALKGVENYIGLGEKHPYSLDYEKLLNESSPDEPQADVSEDDLFVLSYTSGTTGRPKAATITGTNSISGILSMAIYMRLVPNDVYLLHAPMFFGAAGGARLHCVLRGCTSIITTFRPREFLEIIEKEQITAFSLGPTGLRMLANEPEIGKYDLSSVRKIVVSGGRLSVPIWQKLQQFFGQIFYPGYGMTESSISGTMVEPEEIAAEGPLAKRIASVGKPCFSADVRVVNEAGGDVTHDGHEVGEIIMHGDPITKGYWKEPETTAETIRSGWLYTGDMATVDEDGFLYIVDRKKDMIKSGGINIFPKEIEDIIYTHHAVLHAAVIGVPDEKWGETVKAMITLKEGTTASEEEIIELCKKNLASYKKPTSVEFIDHMPLTADGKPLKRELKEKH